MLEYYIMMEMRIMMHDEMCEVRPTSPSPVKNIINSSTIVVLGVSTRERAETKLK
jgi:hypothetical protein